MSCAQRAAILKIIPSFSRMASSATLREFYRWSMMENPQLRHDARFEQVDALAELAGRYHVHALGWQTSDRIRHQLYRGLWHLTAETVSDKYKHLTPDNWLSQLYRVALGTTAKHVPANVDYDVAQWRRAVAETPALGMDLIEAYIRRSDGDSLRVGGPCRFHDHGKRALPRDRKNSEWLCPFTDGGCFTVEPEPTEPRRKVETSKDGAVAGGE